MGIALKVTVERGEVAAGEETVDVGLGVPVFVAVAGVAEEAVVAESFQIAILDAEESHEGFVVVDARFSAGGDTVFLTF